MQCPSCRTENPETARFCHQCGASLAAPRELEGERKQATILFADVVGSTATAERLDPEAWTETMNGAFGFMIEAVTRYGGTVGRLMGDGVPARLQGMAQPNTVLIGPETGELLRHRFELEPQGEVVGQGRSAPVELHRVLGVRDAAGRTHGPERGVSPLVGRERERAEAERRLDALAAGRGGALVVVGDAGVGKSRLVAELRARAEGASLRWLEGRAVSYAASVLYYPWRQVLLAGIDAAEGDAPAHVRQRLADAVRGHGAVTADDLPFLEAVLAVDTAEDRERLATLSGDALVERIGGAVRACVTSLAGRRPMALVFDDLHWADPATVALLDAVTGAVREAPLLLVLVARPMRDAAAWPLLERVGAALGPLATTLALEPLGGDDAAALLAQLLGADGLPEEVRALILQKTDGNPLFLEEVVRSLIESGQVVRDDGRWRAAASIRDVKVPDSLAGLLSARIDRLPDPARRVAQTASVIGRAFARGVLVSVIDEAPAKERLADVPRHLATLEAQDARRVGDAYGAATIADQLADVHLRLGRHERALTYLDPAIAFYRDRGMAPALARSLGRETEARLALQRVKEA